jgi:DNA polymerase bacteriophage-type
MMIVSIDFETRSRIGIEGGAWKYAAHPSTEVICMAIKVDDGPTLLHWPEKWELILGLESEISMAKACTLIWQADRVEAHNAEFEMAIWEHVLKLRHPNWHCTMAKAAMHALPLSLEKLCEALNSPVQKDKKGNMLMKKICQPQKDGTFIDDLEIFKAVGEYCRTDVEAQYMASRMLDDLLPIEQAIWRLTIKKNKMGLPIDRTLVDNAITLWQNYEEKLKAEFVALTGVPSPSCLQQFLAWLDANGCDMTDLRAASVAEVLSCKGVMIPAARRALEIRAELGKTSIKKFEALRGIAEADDRARGLFLYHGATTGRWAGRGFQPQNLPSRGLIAEVPMATRMILAGSPPEDFDLLWPSLSQVLSSCIRAAIKAPKGKTFFCADFSAIEARVLAWLAGEQWVLDAYSRDEDLYIKAASKIYHKPEGNITKSERQIGKVSVLACGYAGGKQAFANMASNYGISIDLDEAQEIVTGWRQANPKIVEWWYELERAAINAIKEPGTSFHARSVGYRVDGRGYLRCTLPSGRDLYYPEARLGLKTTPWGEQKQVILYNTVVKGKYQETHTYSGCLAENCIAEGTQVLTDSGWKNIEHIRLSDKIHDGAEFVNHSGLLLKSTQACVIVDGVYMTPEHEVLTNEGWKTASSNPEPYRPDLWLSNSHQPLPHRWDEKLLVGSLPMRETLSRSGERANSLPAARPHSELRVHDLSHDKKGQNYTRYEPTPRVRSVAVDAGAMSTQDTPSLAQLRGAGNICVRTLAEVREFLGRYATRLRSRAFLGTNKQRRELPQGKLHMGNPTRTGMQQKVGSENPHPEWFVECVRSRCAIRNRCNNNPVSDKPRLAGRPTVDKTRFSPAFKKVYDIMNCGPRNRFVVAGESSPFIVHNCTQGVARDLMANAMLNLDAAGFLVILLCHDEAMTEFYDSSNLQEHFEEFLRQMVRLPSWAKGLPIKAEGWRGERYRK